MKTKNAHKQLRQHIEQNTHDYTVNKKHA